MATRITVGSQLSEHVGTNGCLDGSVKCLETEHHHRILYYSFLMRGRGQEIVRVCMCYYSQTSLIQSSKLRTPITRTAFSEWLRW